MLIAVFHQSHGIQINCNFVNYLLWPQQGLHYTCQLKDLVIDSDNVKITGVSGNHRAEHSNEDVEVLWADQQQIKRLPRKLHKFFPNIKALVITDSMLQAVQSSDLVAFKKLQSIDLQGNEIKSIDGDLFRNNPDIQYISISNNPLQHVGPNIFDSLTGLTEVNFGDCRCINETVSQPEELDEFKYSLLVNCPPTYEMIEKAILTGPTFTKKVKELREMDEALQSEVTQLRFLTEILRNRLENMEDKV